MPKKLHTFSFPLLLHGGKTPRWVEGFREPQHRYAMETFLYLSFSRKIFSSEKYILPEPEKDIPGYSVIIIKAVNRIWPEFAVFTT